jgi:DNA-directed RNA polymerase subunit RPC12/RpoP
MPLDGAGTTSVKPSETIPTRARVTFPAYLILYACLECRKAFKRHNDADALTMKCPDCGGSAHRTSRKFKPPKRSDLQQWEKVRFLLENGFRYLSVRDDSGRYTRYPETLAEAREFVRKYRNQAWEPIAPGS